tara:strand:- start:7801 stop:8403 length:603 start_codon:yes stop_codon:yes gene_type:complete
MKKQILIATRNQGKIKEIREFLNEEFEILGLDDFEIKHEVEETGTTFKENAIKKAKEYGEIANIMTISDDSGLAVDILNGEPGVYSARYGGQGLSDEERTNLLLNNLKDFKQKELTARFCCVIAVWAPNKKIKTFCGTIEGQISTIARGNNGFGYDPIFYYPPKGKNLAEITLQEKQEISHRSKAVFKAVKYIKERNKYE